MMMKKYSRRNNHAVRTKSVSFDQRKDKSSIQSSLSHSCPAPGHAVARSVTVKSLSDIADLSRPLGKRKDIFVHRGKNPERAVKTFFLDFKLARDELQNELDKASKLLDPCGSNLVKIYEPVYVLREKRFSFSIIMDLLQLSLDRLMMKRKEINADIPTPTWAPLRKKLELLSGVAKAIRFLHKNEIIHGNLKSSNVFIPHQLPVQGDWSVHVKVSDYCIEKFIAISDNILPLDAKRSGKDGIVRVEWGPEVDVFSYGLLAFEISLGKFPSIGESLEGSWECVKQDELEMRKDLFTSIPPEELSVVGDLIKVCLKPSPERLPMNEVHKMVDQWIQKLKEKVDIPLGTRSIPSGQGDLDLYSLLNERDMAVLALQLKEKDMVILDREKSTLLSKVEELDRFRHEAIVERMKRLELETEIYRLKSDLNKSYHSAEVSKLSMANLQDKLQWTQKELEAKDEEVREAHRTYSDLKDELNLVKCKQLDDMQYRLAIAKEEIATVKEEQASLARLCQVYNSKLKRITVEYAQIKDEIMSLVCERLGSTESKLLLSIEDHNSLTDAHEAISKHVRIAESNSKKMEHEMRKLERELEIWRLQSISKDLQPTLEDLQFHVVESVYDSWERIGHYLGLEQSVLNLVKIEHHQMDERCLAVFQKWLAGSGKVPKTWSTVLEALRLSDLKPIANEVWSSINKQENPAVLGN